MHYEVELKFSLPADELGRVRKALDARGIIWHPSREQQDQYWGHPARDFAETDEALRIRQEEGRAYLTYKGPKIDPSSKTRQELELDLTATEGSAARLSAIFEALGFVAFAVVRKRRTPGTLTWQGRDVHVSVDEVDTLGTFLELEISATESGLAEAQAAVKSLAGELGLPRGIRRSYLEMLLDHAS